MRLALLSCAAFWLALALLVSIALTVNHTCGTDQACRIASEAP